MADPISPETTDTIYIFQENRVVRTGCLLFYDPLLFSDIYDKTLSQLWTYSGSIPSNDLAVNTFPTGINAISDSVIITR
jgi:hypothetical protein